MPRDVRKHPWLLYNIDMMYIPALCVQANSNLVQQRPCIQKGKSQTFELWMWLTSRNGSLKKVLDLNISSRKVSSTLCHNNKRHTSTLKQSHEPCCILHLHYLCHVMRVSYYSWALHMLHFSRLLTARSLIRFFFSKTQKNGWVCNQCQIMSLGKSH